MQGKSKNFWFKPKFSPSARVCGNSWFNVSGSKRDKNPPTMPKVPKMSNGRSGEIFAWNYKVWFIFLKRSQLHNTS